MARDLCIQFPNAFYHVFSRGINRQQLFYDDDDNNVFLNLCRKATVRYGIRIFAFCLMTNHYHLYISTPYANLSKVMKFINQSYAIYFLSKYPEKDGHVFKGRYKRKVVQDDKYSKVLINYIHANPTKANLVTNLEEWRWSSYYSFIDPQARLDFVDYDWVLSHFDDHGSECKNFVEFHEDQSASIWTPTDVLKAKTFMADDEFIKHVCDEHLEFDSLKKQNSRVMNELRYICNKQRLTEWFTKLNFDSKTNLKLKVYILAEYCGFSFKAIARLVAKTEPSVSKILQRFKKNIINDEGLEQELINLLA